MRLAFSSEARPPVLRNYGLGFYAVTSVGQTGPHRYRSREVPNLRLRSNIRYRPADADCGLMRLNVIATPGADKVARMQVLHEKISTDDQRNSFPELSIGSSMGPAHMGMMGSMGVFQSGMSNLR
jgi:hypothetical protein